MANRNYKLTGIWASNAKTSIPDPPVKSTAYRNTKLTANTVNTGQQYGEVAVSSTWNQLLWEISSLLKEIEAQGLPSYSSLINYAVGVLVLGSDNNIYMCIKANGPTSGAVDPAGSNSSGSWFNVTNSIKSPNVTTISGNAGTATKLQTARKINGIAFDGTKDITISVPEAGTITPKANGTAGVGTSTKYAREDHVHPAAAVSNVTTITGNAGTATKLQTARKINGIAFDGSADITIPIPDATTTTPKANGTAAVGSETKWAKGDHVHPLQTTISGNAATATKLATARKINNVAFDGSADITIPIPAAATATPKASGTAAVGTSTKYAKEDHVHPAQTSVTGSSGSCTGNAATATKLATARTINGVSFDGTANITINASGVGQAFAFNTGVNTTRLPNGGAWIACSANGTYDATIRLFHISGGSFIGSIGIAVRYI